MVDSRQVAALLYQVKSATSPVAKVRAVMQAWQVIRAMSPHDRKKVVMELGFEGAEGLVDRVAEDRGGVPPDMLKEALHRAGSSDPDDVEHLITELRHPETRKGAVQRGLEKIENILVHGTAASEEERLEAALAAGQDSEEPHTEEGTDEPEEDAGGAEALSAEAAAEPEPAPGHSVEPRQPTGDGEALRPASARPAPPPPRQTGQATPRDRRERKLEPSASARRRHGGVEPPPAPKTPASAPPPAGTRQPPASRPSPFDLRAPAPEAPGEPRLMTPPAEDRPRESLGLVGRLRRLRARLEELRSADEGELRREVEGCGPEWARRRALLALLATGIPRDPEVAASLIADLASPSARRWCLNTLVRQRGLDQAQRSRLATRLGV